ncbi:hypothetical protein [Streptomyces sp. 2231.1]|uniref:hypothetical protein n=1 Tax=Streptomyces sp. 2231.1 TaxID=1855347 RepID=UPI00115FDA9B|nr:hypothetical protein [Streptomyces sp. 2231.1]
MITLARTGKISEAFRAYAEEKTKDAIRRTVTEVRPATLPLIGLSREERISVQNKLRRALYRNAIVRARREMADDLYRWLIASTLLIGLTWMTILYGVGVLLGLAIWYVGIAVGYLIVLACLKIRRAIGYPIALTVLASVTAGPIIITLAYFANPNFLTDTPLLASISKKLLLGFELSSVLMSWIFVAFFIGTAIGTYIENRSAARDSKAGPYDHAVSEWAAALRRLIAAGSNWPTRESIKEAVESLSDLAVKIESDLSMPWLHSALPSLSPHLKSDARRVAACIRQNRDTLLRSGHGEEYARVVESISHGLISLTLGSRETLLANAPELPKSTMIRDTLKRMYPGFIFLSAGMLIPLIPQIAEQGDLASKVRIAFTVMGVLVIASAPTEAAQKVNEVIAKVLPLGKP